MYTCCSSLYYCMRNMMRLDCIKCNKKITKKKYRMKAMKEERSIKYKNHIEKKSDYVWPYTLLTT